MLQDDQGILGSITGTTHGYNKMGCIRICLGNCLDYFGRLWSANQLLGVGVADTCSCKKKIGKRIWLEKWSHLFKEKPNCQTTGNPFWNMHSDAAPNGRKESPRSKRTRIQQVWPKKLPLWHHRLRLRLSLWCSIYAVNHWKLWQHHLQWSSLFWLQAQDEPTPPKKIAVLWLIKFKIESYTNIN